MTNISQSEASIGPVAVEHPPVLGVHQLVDQLVGVGVVQGQLGAGLRISVLKVSVVSVQPRLQFSEQT